MIKSYLLNGKEPTVDKSVLYMYILMLVLLVSISLKKFFFIKIELIYNIVLICAV